MSIKTALSVAALVIVTAVPAFAATPNLTADRAALATARMDLHKDYMARAHDRHLLYVAVHQGKSKIAAVERHKIALDNAAIHRDSGAIYRARLALHRDYVAMHHPMLHATAPTKS